MSVQAVHLAVISTGGRLRKLSRPKVRELADSITEIGLLNPITVCETGSEYALVAGRHRLEAVRDLGWQTIPANVVTLSDADRHIAEIDENLIRNDLTDLERGEHLSARKRWYEAKHPETRRGVAGGKARQGSATEIISFAGDAADKTGVTERSIRQDVQIAESIPEDVRDALRETPLAESKTDLIAIARLPEADQRAIVAETDLSDKHAVRSAISARRPSKSEPDDEPVATRHYTAVETTVDAFALAIVSVFSPADCRRIIDLVREAI